jgi:prephenate dehydrogenase
MSNRVTIIGLGCVGCSIGLALRQREQTLEVVGFDMDPARVREATRLGAIARSTWGLPEACQGAGLIILAVGQHEVRETLEMIGPHLEEGCIVTDTAPLKVPVIDWARQYLPPSARFVPGVPLPGPAAGDQPLPAGPEGARADLFTDGLYCVTPAADTDPQALNVLMGLARTLGARTIFVDPLEHDGLQAGVVDLPALIAVALLRATVDSPGWLDMRKVAGPDFLTMTGPATGDASLLATAVLNRENLVRRLDMFMDALYLIRQQLMDNDASGLEEAYTQAATARERWQQERRKGEWGERPDMSEVPGLGEHIARLLVGGLADRFRSRRREGQSPRE